MHFVYIIYSKKTNRFYVGESPDVAERLNFHNDPERNTNSTKSGMPWELFWKLEVPNRIIARKIESHIKSMKSTRYYYNLIQFPEISAKLLEKYAEKPL